MLQGLRQRRALELVNPRHPRLRARLGGRVNPPQLPLLVLLSLGELVLDPPSSRWGAP